MHCLQSSHHYRHRLAFDRVVVIDAASISGSREPAALMQPEGNLFEGLVESQGL
ncbi:hypothetical protein P280DRAFT_470313, partial [Massarina eburnea CBS 473.64]